LLREVVFEQCGRQLMSGQVLIYAFCRSYCCVLYFNVFPKTKLVSFTYDPRWFPGQSLRKNFFLTRNAVDRSYRHCHFRIWSSVVKYDVIIFRISYVSPKKLVINFSVQLFEYVKKILVSTQSFHLEINDCNFP